MSLIVYKHAGYVHEEKAAWENIQVEKERGEAASGKRDECPARNDNSGRREKESREVKERAHSKGKESAVE